MKIKKHTITHAIKYIFLSLLLALPFIAMLPSTFYYAFNQNAQDNTANEINYPYSTNKINNLNDLKENTILKFDNLEISPQQGNILISIRQNEDSISAWFTLPEDLTIDLFLYTNETEMYTNTISIFNNAKKSTLNISINNNEMIIYDNNIWEIYIYDSYITNKNNSLYTLLSYYDEELSNNEYQTINFTEFLNMFLVSDFLGYPTIIEHDLNNQNAFYYASSQVFEKPLFNWVKNSIFVVPIMGMLGIFGISEMNFISSLLVYWVNILSIYAILNIILLVVEKLGSFGKRKNE